MTHDITRALKDETATLALGAELAARLHPGLTIYLHGDLGAGKTTLTRGLLQALGHQGRVKSPTYTLVEPYVVSGINLYHFDLYRFIDPEEWEAAGFREYFNADSICVVEWPQQAGDLLPAADIDIRLQTSGAGRSASIHANSAAARLCLDGLHA